MLRIISSFIHSHMEFLVALIYRMCVQHDGDLVHVTLRINTCVCITRRLHVPLLNFHCRAHCVTPCCVWERFSTFLLALVLLYIRSLRMMLRCHCTNNCNSFDSISILFFECVTKYTFSKCLFPSKLYTAYRLSLGGFIFCITWILSFVVPSFYIFIHLTFSGNLMKLSLLI